MNKKKTSVMKIGRKSMIDLLMAPLSDTVRLHEYKDLNMIHHFHVLMIRQDYYRCSCCC